LTSKLLLDRADTELTLEDVQNQDNESINDVKSYHDCLVGSYMSYLKAAGYSKIPHEVKVFEQAARRFLSKFPDPQEWVTLSVEEQYRCDHKERSFVHYLILRRLLPMPLPYMLTPKPRFYQMATRLMERETFQHYQKAAQRLKYSEQNVREQFCALLCLMTWTQKSIDALTLDDLDTFIQELRAAFLSVKRRRKSIRNGLPTRWDSQLGSLRNVLYHMGIIPQLTRSTRRTSFEKQWEDIPPGIAAPVRRYLQQMGLSLRPSIFNAVTSKRLRNTFAGRLSSINQMALEMYFSRRPGTTSYLLCIISLSASLSGSGRKLPSGYWYFPEISP